MLKSRGSRVVLAAAAVVLVASTAYVVVRRWKPTPAVEPDESFDCMHFEMNENRLMPCPRLLTIADTHRVIEVSDDEVEEEIRAKGGGSMVYADYCAEHCPGGCVRGCALPPEAA